MAHVFISYCREDRQFAQRLCELLTDAQFSTWMDLSLRAGDSWREEIDEAIKGASTLVVILSADAKKSTYVNYEWAFALGAGLTVVPVLLGLRSEDVPSRLATLHALDFSDPRSRPWDDLYEALQKASDSLLQATISSPGSAPPVVKDAARGLDSLDAAERERAIQTLKQMNHPAAVEVLAGASHHPVREVRIHAAYALAERKDPRAIPELLETIRNPPMPGHEGRDEYEVYPYQLAEIGRAAVPELCNALGDENSKVRSKAAATLGLIGDDDALPALIAILEDQDEWVRAAAIGALAEFGNRVPTPPVAKRLTDESSEVRRAAAKALGEIGSSDGLGGLIGALGDPDYDVRIRIVLSLGQIGGPAAMEALLECLKNDRSDQVRCNAAESLGRIKDPAAARGLWEAAAQDDSGIVKTRSFQALVAIGGGEVIGLLLDTLGSPVGDDQERAASALGEIGDRGAISGLVNALNNEKPGVRSEAASALGEIGDAAAMPALVEALNDPTQGVRERVAAALQRIGTPEARSAVREWRQRKV